MVGAELFKNPTTKRNDWKRVLMMLKHHFNDSYLTTANLSDKFK